jgi:hypothetical protein
MISLKVSFRILNLPVISGDLGLDFFDGNKLPNDFNRTFAFLFDESTLANTKALDSEAMRLGGAERAAVEFARARRHFSGVGFAR